MYTMIGVSFTLKGQDFANIQSLLANIVAAIGESGRKIILVHGFMPKHVVIEKGFKTEVVDALSELFPLQVNCYTTEPLRKEMADILYEKDGRVYVIGDVKDGVAEEVAMYSAKGIRVIHIPLDWKGELNDLL